MLAIDVSLLIVNRLMSYFSFSPISDDMEFACSSKSLCELIKKLTDSQIKVVKNLGFGCILKIREIKLRPCLLKFIITSYNPTTSTFKIRDADLEINNNDVYCILGLPFAGMVVNNIKPLPADSAMVEKYIITPMSSSQTIDVVHQKSKCELVPINVFYVCCIL